MQVGLGINREPWVVDIYANEGFGGNELSLPSKLVGGIYVFRGSGDVRQTKEATYSKVAAQNLLPALDHIEDKKIRSEIAERFIKEELTVEIVELLVNHVMGVTLWCKFTTGEFTEEDIQQAVSYLLESGADITEYNIIGLLNSPLGDLEC